MPPTGLISPGLAGTIIVDPAVDQTVGGNPSLLRDGAISGNPAYKYNPGNKPAFPLACSNWSMGSPPIGPSIRRPWASRMRA